MSASTDPFERAVRREGVLRKRAAPFMSQTANLKMVMRWMAAMIFAWGAILTGHWLLLSDPRWLAVAHTIVYAVYSSWVVLAALFVLWMTRRRQEVFGDPDV